LRDLHKIGGAVTARELHKAQAITMRIETESFGIDRNDRAEAVIFWKVAAMKTDGHEARTTSKRGG
jgi:hypothetical protein